MKIVINLKEKQNNAVAITNLFKDVEARYKNHPLVEGFDIK